MRTDGPDLAGVLVDHVAVAAQRVEEPAAVLRLEAVDQPFEDPQHRVVAVSVFPGEQYQAPRSWAEEAYPNLIYFNELDKGGHFAAWEQPELFAEEIRAAFRSLR